MYTNPPDNATVVCADELGPLIPRKYPDPPGWTSDGHRVKEEVEYWRDPYKTWVYGGLRVRDGHAVTMCASSRNSLGYQDFLTLLEDDNPTGQIIVITDNLSSHTSVSTRDWLADHPRITQVFIPKNACWLNLQEPWWRMFRRQGLDSYGDRNTLIVRGVVNMFSERMNTELVQQFWEAMQHSAFITEAAQQVGTYREMGGRWMAATGGIRPRRGLNLKGRCLSLRDREEIALARAAGESMRSIAVRLGRHPSTISRELARNGRDGRYRATSAHALAYRRASRPKSGKLVSNPVLRQRVEQDLTKCYSPEQIVGRLRLEFPDDPSMHLAVETIYRALYLPSCGGLNRGLTRCLRTGRRLRRPRRLAGQRKNRIPDMVNIAQRPTEAGDRTVVGHWEGDLIVGRNNRTAIATLVERATGTTMLVHLPEGYKAEQLREPLTQKLLQLPETLRRSLTWDQGVEMRDWKQVAAATGIGIYFCDPHSPWQRGTNENTNGLLRQYFVKGSDLSVHSPEDLERVAAELNDRPRKRLGFRKPIELIGPLLR